MHRTPTKAIYEHEREGEKHDGLSLIQQLVANVFCDPLKKKLILFICIFTVV